MTGGLSSRMFISVSRASGTPTPLSLTSISTPPLGISWPDMCTGVSLGEKIVAFSMISASRCTTSDTAGPVTEMPGWIFIATLLYCSISDVAARTTSASGTGSLHLRAVSCPASRSRFSEFRRILVTRWSMEKRLDSRLGSASFCSRESIMRARRSISDWLRRDKLTNIALKLLRSIASLPASRTASACTWSNARATWPISSADSTSIGATSRLVAGSVSSPSRRTRSGSCTVAMSSAPSRSLRSGWTRDLATASVAISTRNRMTVVTTALNSADCSASRRSTWLRATMFLATSSSTACILSILSDIAEYQRAGAFFRLMPSICVMSARFPSPRMRSSISSATFTPCPATVVVKEFCSAGVAVASNDALSLSSSDSAVVSACCSPSPKN